MRTLFSFLCLLTLTASTTGAQTGAFADGEVLVEAYQAPSTRVYRIDPLTGNGAQLIDGLYDGYQGAGWIAYDPWRDGVLMYTSWQPAGLFAPRLWLVHSSGQIVDIGLLNGKVTALAPAGDGRVYLRQNGVLSVLDKWNQVTPVPDSSGVPISDAYDHLIYDAPNNTLVAAALYWSGVGCVATSQVTTFSLPLVPDGSALSGLVSCSAYPILGNSSLIGLDHLPNGSVLGTFVGGADNDRMLEIDPATAVASLWAEPAFADLDGGVWGQTIGAAIVLEDFSDELRTYAQFGTGTGTLLPVSVSLADGTTGTSTRNGMTDVNISGTPCPGASSVFGVGLAGTGGKTPTLGAGSCPRIGEPLPLTLFDGANNGLAILGLSLSTAPYPLFGGTGYLLPPILVQLALPLSSSGVAYAVLPIPNDPAFSGLSVYGQAGVLDAGAPQGVSLTAGLELAF